jgi:aminoglycoside 3-N-acetyltransferase
MSPISRREFKDILQNKLDIKKGDNVFIHASNSMLNVECSPLEMIDIIRDCIGDEALICVPTFPRSSSVDFLKKDTVFDGASERSGMGALSECIRTMDGACRSDHPIKSIAAIGPGAEELLSGHEDSKYSFDQASPYYKLLDKGVKVIGIGAQLSYLTFVHVPEDCNRDTYPIEVYHTDPITKKIRVKDGSIVEKDYYAHDLNVVSKANPEKFVRRNIDNKYYRIYNHFLTPFFQIDANELYKAILKRADVETIYY